MDECDQWWKEHYCTEVGPHTTHYCGCVFGTNKIRCDFSWTDDDVKKRQENNDDNPPV